MKKEREEGGRTGMREREGGSEGVSEEGERGRWKDWNEGKGRRK